VTYGQCPFGERPAVDADAFAHVVEVWRGVQPHVEAGLPEHAFGHAGRAALAVRAGNLHAAVRLLWVVEVGEEVLRRLDARSWRVPS
jgi:hypothetical protein